MNCKYEAGVNKRQNVTPELFQEVVGRFQKSASNKDFVQIYLKSERFKDFTIAIPRVDISQDAVNRLCKISKGEKVGIIKLADGFHVRTISDKGDED